MNTHQLMAAFAESAAEAFRLAGPVYQFAFEPEAGDADWPDLSGSFPDGQYLSCAIGPQSEFVRLPFPDGSARTVVCCGVPEEAGRRRAAMRAVVRLLAPGGAMLVAVPVDGEQDPEAIGHWPVTPSSLQGLVTPLETALLGWQGLEYSPQMLYAVALRGPRQQTPLNEINRFLACFQQRLSRLRRGVGAWQRCRRFFAELALPRAEKRRRRAFYEAQFILQLKTDGTGKESLLQECLLQQGPGRQDTAGATAGLSGSAARSRRRA